MPLAHRSSRRRRGRVIATVDGRISPNAAELNIRFNGLFAKLLTIMSLLFGWSLYEFVS